MGSGNICCFRAKKANTSDAGVKSRDVLKMVSSVDTNVDIELLDDTSKSTTKARVITNVDFENNTFYLSTQGLSYDVWGFSHRWEDRGGAETWQVLVSASDNGDESQSQYYEEYTCLMFPHEVQNVQSYLETGDCSGLWLDYVCINQNDEKDKCAQVGIMGTLYMSVTSLVVGKGLAPTMPSIDYTERAWCMQERMFGKIKFPQNFEEEAQDNNEAHVQKFAHDMISRLPGLVNIQKYTLQKSCHWDYNEGWRLNEVRSCLTEEMYKDCTNELEQMMISIREENVMKTSLLALEIREKVDADLNIDQKEWTNLMNSCSATYQHDRIYGKDFEGKDSGL